MHSDPGQAARIQAGRGGVCDLPGDKPLKTEGYQAAFNSLRPNIARAQHNIISARRRYPLLIIIIIILYPNAREEYKL